MVFPALLFLERKSALQIAKKGHVSFMERVCEYCSWFRKQNSDLKNEKCSSKSIQPLILSETNNNPEDVTIYVGFMI